MSDDRDMLADYHEEVLRQTQRANRERDRADGLAAELTDALQEVDRLRELAGRLARRLASTRPHQPHAVTVKKGRRP